MAESVSDLDFSRAVTFEYWVGIGRDSKMTRCCVIPLLIRFEADAEDPEGKPCWWLQAFDLEKGVVGFFRLRSLDAWTAFPISPDNPPITV